METNNTFGRILQRIILFQFDFRFTLKNNFFFQLNEIINQFRLNNKFVG